MENVALDTDREYNAKEMRQDHGDHRSGWDNSHTPNRQGETAEYFVVRHQRDHCQRGSILIPSELIGGAQTL